jgi:hypothetical protein
VAIGGSLVGNEPKVAKRGRERKVECAPVPSF